MSPRPLVPLLALAALAACAGEERQGPPGRGVLLVAIDGWRWDHLGLAGYDRNTSARLEHLAQDGVLFDNTWTTAADLIAAHTSLLTGCDPLVAEAPDIPLVDGTRVAPAYRWTIPDQVPRLAAQLFQDGWNTAAFVDDPRLGRLRGVPLGFHDVAQFGGGGMGEDRIFGFTGVGVRFADWLETVDEGEDWFAYLHVHDLDRMWAQGARRMREEWDLRPELDFVPPVGRAGPVYHAIPPDRRGGRSRTLAELEATYDTALFELDKLLERVFQHVEEHADWERTTIALVGTYGTCFGEGGILLDSGGLTEADLHVPLLVRPAPEHGFPVGRRSDAVVSLLDVAPTLLTLAEARVPEAMHGVSLVPLLAGTQDEVRAHAFARSTLIGGRAAVDRGALLATLRVEDGTTNILAKSYAGLHASDVAGETVTRFVRTGSPAPAPRQPIDDEGRRVALQAAVGAWYRDVADVRDLLHLEPWQGAPDDPARLEELRAAGLLDPDWGTQR